LGRTLRCRSYADYRLRQEDDAITQAENKGVAEGVAALGIAETKASAGEGSIQGLPIDELRGVHEYAMDCNSGQF